MGRYSRLLSPPLADLAGVRGGQRVLDVGCGPGALTAELVKRLGLRPSQRSTPPSRSSPMAAFGRPLQRDGGTTEAELQPMEDERYGAIVEDVNDGRS